jgi:hypothetical protein
MFPVRAANRAILPVLWRDPGTALMSRADPGRWTDLVEGYTAAHAAGGDLKACLDAAQKVGREQRCTVTVRPVLPTH